MFDQHQLFQLNAMRQRQRMIDQQKEQTRILAGGRPREPAKENSDDGLGFGCWIFIIGFFLIGSAYIAHEEDQSPKIKIEDWLLWLAILVSPFVVFFVGHDYFYLNWREKKTAARQKAYATQARAKSERTEHEQLIAQNKEKRIALSYLYIHMATIDGDGVTPEESSLLHELYAARIQSLENAQLSGPEVAEIISSSMDFYSGRKGPSLRQSIADSVSRLTAQCVTIENKLGIIDDLEAIGTVDGVMSETQFMELQTVAEKLAGTQSAGVNSKLYAITYLHTLIAYWDMDGITQLEYEKIYSFIYEWENGVSQQEFDQLMIKADISYEKDLASGSMLDIFRATSIVQKSMNANEIARLFQQFDELANIQGKHPEQESFIGGLKEQLQPHS